MAGVYLGEIPIGGVKVGVFGEGVPVLQKKSALPRREAQTIRADSGYDGLSEVFISGASELIASNIKDGINIFGVIGNYSGEEAVLQEKTVTPSTAKQDVTPDNGYDGLSKVTVEAMPAAELGTPAIQVNTAGKITATVQQAASGYVPAGSKSATQQLETKSAETFTPGTTDKSIAPGVYLVGAQTIKGDPNLTGENIKKGVSIFGVPGEHEGGGGAAGGVYVWTQHNIGSIESYTTKTGTTSYSKPSDAVTTTYYKTYTLDPATGIFTLTEGTSTATSGYYIKSSSGDNVIYKYSNSFMASYQKIESVLGGSTPCKGDTCYGVVTSESKTAYPEDGSQGGYWYVLVGQSAGGGGGGSSPVLQSKTVTPGASAQTVRPDSGYDGLSQVTVNGDTDLVASNIKSGVNIFGVTGNYSGTSTSPKMQTKTVTPGASAQDVTPDSGYDGLSKVTVAGDADLIPGNIKSGVNIFGVTGSLVTGGTGGSSDDNCEAYVVDATNPVVHFKRTTGTIKAWGFAAYKQSTYMTTNYAFTGDTQTTISTMSNTEKALTLSVDASGNLSGLPANLTSGTLLVTRGI